MNQFPACGFCSEEWQNPHSSSDDLSRAAPRTLDPPLLLIGEMFLCGCHPAFAFSIQFLKCSEVVHFSVLAWLFVRWLTDPLQRCLCVEVTLPSHFSIQFLKSSEMVHFSVLAWLFVRWLTDPLQRCLYVEVTLPSRFPFSF